MSRAIELTLDDVRRDADAVHAWLRLHDLDPNRTIPRVRVEVGRVSAELYLLDEHGQKYLVDQDGQKALDRDRNHAGELRLATETVERPLRAPVPAGLGTVIE